MKRAIITLVVLVTIAVLAATLGPRLLSRPTQEDSGSSLVELSDRAGQTFVAVRGTVVPTRWTHLSSARGGVLLDIKASLGMTVTAGQVLALLDKNELEQEVRLSEAELAVCKATLDDLKQGPSQAELDAMEASYAAALASYERLKAGPTDQEKAIAVAELRLAERDVQQAQAAYDIVRNRPDVGARPEALQLERATIEYEIARASYELAVAGPDEADLESAKSQVANAKYQLEKGRRGADVSALAAAEAALTRAEVALSRARLALEEAELKAPFDGVVTAVTDSRPGELIQAGQMVVTIADLSQLQVEVEDLDEWGAANVTRDQTVDLVVTALNNLTPRGRLIYVSQEPTITSTGVATYRAVITLDQQLPGLLWGMTVRAKLYLPAAQRAGFR